MPKETRPQQSQGGQGLSVTSTNYPGLNERNFKNPTNNYGVFSNKFGGWANTNGFGRGEMTNRFGSRAWTNGFGDRAITNGFSRTNEFKNDLINENTHSNRHQLKEPFLTDPRVMGNNSLTNN